MKEDAGQSVLVACDDTPERIQKTIVTLTGDPKKRKGSIENGKMYALFVYFGDSMLCSQMTP